MNNNVIISFLVLLCLFISAFLNISFSDHHKNSLIDIVDIAIPEKIDNIIISDGDYRMIEENSNYNSINIKDELKIYYVGSYDPGHVCGQPQINSFFKRIKDIDDDFGLKVDIEGWYLDTVKTFTDKTQVNDISSHVIKDIRRYNPDIIYVVDDAAFEYIGITLSEDFPIFFSGINQSYKGYSFKYKGIINNNNMFGVDELTNIDSLYNLFKSARIFPNKWYFINDKTEVASYVFDNLRDELYKIGVSYEVFDVNSTREYIDTIKSLNNKAPGIIANNVHSLYSDDYKEVLDTTSLTMLLIRYNKVHLDFSINKGLCKYGLSIVNGPDYNKMGYLVGNMFINTMSRGVKSHKVNRLKSEITINYKRIEDLTYYRGLLDHLDKVDNIISSY